MLRLFRRTDSRDLEIAHVEVAHSGETYRVALKRVSTARRFTLRVRAATRDVVLTMPTRGSTIAARDFAARHAAWIGARLRRLPQPVALVPGNVIPLRGIDHVILHRPYARGTVWISALDSGPYYGPAAAICVAGEEPHISRRVLEYLKRQAKRDLEAAIARHSATVGKPVPKVTLRDTTSRWGSCSANGSLSFSWRLILAPPFVLDYLAAHEVAHLVHMNHSPRFWKLTRKLSADTDRAEAWLKAYGASLHRFGPKIGPVALSF
jgi:predicted metal-dependent hydrolase